MFSYVALTFRCSPNVYRRFIQGFRWIATPLTSMLKTTESSDLAPRELGTDEVVGGGGRADETVVDSSKSSESRRIFKKPEKPQRPEKFAKAIGSEKRLPKHQSSVDLRQRAQAPVRFTRPRSSLDNTFGAITNKAKLVELLMLCRVFLQWEEDLRAEYSNPSPAVTNVPLHQVIVCKTHVIPLLNSGDALGRKTS